MSSRPAAGRRRVVVAGFGNALRGDDGAGWQVARALADRRHADPLGEDGSISILSGHQPLPEWVPTIAESDFAYFVDAGASTGEVQVRPLAVPVHAAPLAAAGLMDGHALGVEGLLAMAQSLYGHAPEAYLITIAAEAMDFTDHLSPRAQAAVDRVAAALEQVLAHGRGGPPPLEEQATCV